MGEETRQKRWRGNIQKAASKMSEQGLPVDTDDLGWEAGKAMAMFYDINPDELRMAAEVAVEGGMIDDKRYQEIMDDANEIERVRKSREESSE